MVAAIPVLFGVVICTFVLVRLLPGDPAAFFASSPNMTPEDVEQIRRQLGLDRSILEQLGIFLKDIAYGNIGTSMLTGRPVLHDMMERLPATMELSVVALLLALLIAVPLGVLSAAWSGSMIDHASRILSVIGVSLPPFVTGVVLIFVFYYLLPWSPDPIGRIDFFVGSPPTVTGFFLLDSLIAGNWTQFRSSAAQLALPSITMAFFVLAPIMRMTRGAMLAALQSDYVRTVQASGLGPWKVYVTYALRNSLTPMITTTGVVFSFMLGANILVEKVFAWPGIGSYTLEAMTVSDYAPVQGFILVAGFIYIVLNMLIDIACAIVDPRMAIS